MFIDLINEELNEINAGESIFHYIGYAVGWLGHAVVDGFAKNTSVTGTTYVP